MTKMKKRGSELPVWADMLMRVAFAVLSTALFGCVAVLICSAVIYTTADPAAYVDYAAYTAYGLTALGCGLFSALFCRDSAFLCALCASACCVILMLIIAVAGGGVSPMCVTLYAAFMLASVLFSGIFSRNKPKTRKRRK